jgi:hypothetical protein
MKKRKKRGTKNIKKNPLPSLLLQGAALHPRFLIYKL